MKKILNANNDKKVTYSSIKRKLDEQICICPRYMYTFTCIFYCFRKLVTGFINSDRFEYLTSSVSFYCIRDDIFCFFFCHPQPVPRLLQQYKLPIQATRFHVWRRRGDASGRTPTRSLPSFPLTSPQSSAPCSAQAWTCKMAFSLTLQSSPSNSVSEHPLPLTAGMNGTDGRWE